MRDTSGMSWASYKKVRKSGEFDDYERERASSLSYVDKDEETRRRYQEYVDEMMASEQQAQIVNNQINQEVNVAPRYIDEQQTGLEVGMHQRRLSNMGSYMDNAAVSSADNTANAMQDVFSAVNSRQNDFDIDVESKKVGGMARRKSQKTLAALEDRLNKRGSLNPEEALQYASASLDNAYTEFDGLADLMAERNTLYSAANKWHAGIEGEYLGSDRNRGRYASAAQSKLKDVEARIQKLTGWDDETMGKYLDYANRLQNKSDNDNLMKKQELAEGASNWERAKRAGTAIGSDIFGLSNNAAFIDNVRDNPNRDTLGIDTNTYKNWIPNIANEANSQVANSINSKAGQFAYNTAYAAADSTLKRIPAMALQAVGVPQAVTEIISLTPYFTQTFNSTYQQNRDRGATDEEARKTATINAAVEVATELIPLGGILKKSAGKSAGKDAIKEILKGMGEEGLEELVSGTVDEIVDSIVFNKDDEVESQFQQRLADSEYDKNGQKNSKIKQWGTALLDFGIDRALEFASGALSTVPSQGVALGVGNSRSKAIQSGIAENAKNVSENTTGDTEYEQSVKAQAEKYSQAPVQALADNINDTTEEGKDRKEKLQSLADKQAKGEKLSVAENIYVNQAVNEEIQAEKDANKKGTLETIKDKLGMREDEASYLDRIDDSTNKGKQLKSDLQNLLDKRNNGEKLTDGENYYLNTALTRLKNRQSLDVLEDYSQVPAQFRSPVSNITEDEARTKLAAAAKNGDAAQMGRIYQEMKNSTSRNVSDNVDEIFNMYSGMAQSNGANQMQIEAYKKSSQDAYLAGLSGENRSVLGNLSKEAQQAYDEGLLKYTNRNITEQSADRVEAKIESLSSETSKSVYRENLKPEDNVNQYNMAWDRFYRAGQVGLDFDKELKNGSNRLIAEVFDKDRLKAMYDAGAQQTRMEEGVKASDNLFKSMGIKKGAGTFQDIRQNKNSDVDYEAYRALATYTGQNIVLADAKSFDFIENENARFNAKDSQIVINADASVAQGLHEALGEFTEFYNSEGFEVVRQSLNRAASETLGTYRYNQIIDNYKRTYAGAGQSNKDIEMSREMTNDMLVAMMATDKGREKLAGLLAENEQASGVVGKIKSIFRKMANSIRDIIKASKLNSLQREMLEKGANELENNVDLFIEAFQKARENAGKVEESAQVSENNAQNEEKMYSINPNGDIDLEQYTEKDLENWKDSTTVIVAHSQKDIVNFLDNELGSSQFKSIKCGRIPNDVADRILKDTGIDVHGLSVAIGTDYEDHHKNEKTEQEKWNQNAMTHEIIARVASHLGNYISARETNVSSNQGQKAIEFIIEDNGKKTVVTFTSKRQRELRLKTMYGQEKKNSQSVTNGVNTPNARTPKTNRNVNSYGLNINQNSNNSKKKFSINVDSEGKQLSKGQKEYFKDSKVVNPDGSLKVMHHGTGAYGFNVFDIKKAKAAGAYGTGFYFSDSDSHAGQYGQTYDVYLNIVNPVTTGTNNIDKDMMLNFINEVANDEDYGIENYGYGATPQSVLDDVWGKDDFAMLQDINATCIGDFAAAVKLFNRINGTSYDGIVAPTETVAFYPNQIKLISNENPTSSEDIRFSLTPDEFDSMESDADGKNVDFGKTLVAVHNMEISQLDADIELKGLPSPSIAIIKAGMEHSRYGNVSLLFKRDTIDPKANKNNKVYGGDAWTPTFPSVEYKINDKVFNKAKNAIYEAVGGYQELDKFGYVGLDTDNMEDALNRNKGSVVESLAHKDGIKYAYIRSQNTGYELPYKTETRTFAATDGHSIEALEYMREYMGDRFDELKGDRFLHRSIYENHDIGKEIIDAINAYYRNEGADFDFYGDEINLDFKPDAMKIAKIFRDARTVSEGKHNESVTTFDNEQFKMDFEDVGGEAGIENWLNTLFDGIIEEVGLRNDKDVFTNSGSRRSWKQLHDAYTLDNIVSLMNKADSKGADGFFAEAATQALATKDFKSVEEMHANEGMLQQMSEEEYDKLKSEHRQRLIEIATEIEDTKKSNSFEALEDAIECINEAIKTGKTLQAIDRGLKKNAQWLNLKPDTAQKVFDLLNDMSNMPTEYFEAKPRRAVWLDEIALAVVPSTTPAETIQKLEKNKIPYQIYEAGNEEQRTQIVSEADSLKFSLDPGDSWVSFEGVSDDEFGFLSDRMVGILEDGMQALKTQTVDEKKINALAVKLRDEFHSTYPIRTLQDNLKKVFAYMQTQDHVNYKEMLGIINDIAKPVIDASVEMVGEEDYKKFRDYMKNKSIRLTENQRKEVAHVFGSYGKFCQQMMPIRISEKGNMDLDQLWDELNGEYSWLFPLDTNEGDKPLALYDALQALKPQPKNEYGADAEEMSNNLAMRIIEEYIEGKPKAEAHNYNEQFIDNIKKEYEQKFNKAISKKNAELEARNKERAQKVRDKQNANDVKNKIRTNAGKLLTWISKPTENRHVPKELVSPVLEFLNALDFVEPAIEELDNGTFQARIVEGSANGKVLWTTIKGNSRAEVYEQVQAKLAEGKGSQQQRKWTDKMSKIKDLFEKAKDESQFEDNGLDTIIGNLDGSLYEQFKDVLLRNDSIDINNINAGDLKIINNVMRNLMAAINKGNRANSINEDIVALAQETMNSSQGKELKNRSGLGNGIHKFFTLDNVNPRTFMTLLGKPSQKLYKALRDGMNTRTWDINKASEYVKNTLKEMNITQEELKKWTGANAEVHTFTLPEGEVQMTTAQIMALYETLKRTGSKERTVGGIKLGDIYRGKYHKAIEQNITVHVNPADLKIIFSVLTEDQRRFADRLQQYLANECSKDGNEVSERLYGYSKFEDPTYFPYTVDKSTLDTRDSTDKRDSYTGIERSGFTHTLQDYANNPLVIKDIFDVFTGHAVDMAAYHGYAAANKDILRWMNYREKSKDNDTGFITWNTNKEAINKLAGNKAGVDYLKKLLLDLNGMEKSSYIGNFTEKLMGSYKAAAVGANIRVIAQQPTAYLRALNDIDAKYLIGNMINVPKAIKYSKIAKEQNATALWKSWGYYETNIGKSMKEVITGVNDPVDRLNEFLMKGAGLADDYTWGALYYAVEKEQRAKYKGQNISDEEFRKAVNDRFDEMVDKTQVVDSTLHRSQLMRGKDSLNKIQTAFMAEPTKSYNMMLEAVLTDTKGDNKKKAKLISRAVGAWVLSNLATSAAAAVADAFRYDTDDDEWLKVWFENFKSNAVDNLFLLNSLPVLKDIAPSILSLFTGEPTFETTSRLDTAGLTSLLDAISQDIKYAKGNSTKSGYGIVMANLKPISQLTGIPLYNLTRDVVAITNQFHEDLTTTVNTATTYKKGIVKAAEDERTPENIKKEVTDAVENKVSIRDAQSYLTSQYKNQYYDLVAAGKTEEAQKLAQMVAPAYAMTGMSDEEIDEMINEWSEESITYSPLDNAIKSGEGIEEAVAKVQEAKDDDKIIEHILKNFGSTVEYERENATESEWESNVDAAIRSVDASQNYESAMDAYNKKQEEKAQKKQEQDIYGAQKASLWDAVAINDGAAGRKAIQDMLSSGKEAGTIKSAISSHYHDMWLETTDSSEKSKIKQQWINATTLTNNLANVKNAKDLNKTWNEWEEKQNK